MQNANPLEALAKALHAAAYRRLDLYSPLRHQATFLAREEQFTLPVVLQRYVGDYATDWGHFAAGALLVAAPTVALFFALQRHLVAGLTAGGVKG